MSKKVALSTIASVALWSANTYCAESCRDLFARLDLDKTLLEGSATISDALLMERYEIAKKILESKNVRFLENPELRNAGKLEILADPLGAPINRYLHRLERVFQVKGSYYFEPNLRGGVAGTHDSITKNISLGPNGILSLITPDAVGGFPGVLPHEFLHAASRKFMFSPEAQHLGPVTATHPFGKSINNRGKYFKEVGYVKTTDAAEIEAQLITGESTLTSVLRIINNSKAVPHEKIEQLMLLKSFQETLAKNLDAVRSNHFDKLQDTFVDSRNFDSFRADVRVIDSEKVNFSPESPEFLAEIAKLAKHTDDVLRPTTLVLVSDPKLANSYLFHLGKMGDTYITKAPSTLKKDEILDWFAEHVRAKQLRATDGAMKLRRASQLTLQLAEGDAATASIVQELRTILSDIRKLHRVKPETLEGVLLGGMKAHTHQLPKVQDIKEVYGLTMDWNIGTATHLGDGLFVTAAHNIAPSVNPFNPKQITFPILSIDDFERTKVLTGTHFDPVNSMTFPQGSKTAFQNPVATRAGRPPDIAFFRSPLNAAFSDLTGEAIKNKAYEGGPLFATVTGLSGPRVVPVEFVEDIKVGPNNLLMKVKGAESFGPGDSGAPLFEVAKDGTRKIVGILHGHGSESGDGYFTQLAPLVDSGAAANPTLLQSTLNKSPAFESFPQ